MLQYSVSVLKMAMDDVKVCHVAPSRWSPLSTLTGCLVMQILGDRLFEKDKDALVIFELEPFVSAIFTHGEPSAHPPDRSRTIHPTTIFVTWNDKSLDKDKYVYHGVRTLSASILEAGIRDGQDLKDAAPYPNFAMYGTPLEKLYGKNVKRLREIKEKYDPFHVMDLTGGFRF